MPKLTKRLIDGLKPREKEYVAWDTELRRFGVRVTSKGRKTFIVQYRTESGRQTKQKIGVFGVLTVEEARTEARSILAASEKGADPAAERVRRRRAPTVREVSERAWTEHVLERCKPTTQREYRRSFDLFIYPAIGGRKIEDVTRADIAELHHKLRHIPYQANRTLGVLSKLFNLAEIWCLRPDGSNPCRHVPKYPEKARERFLSPAEFERLVRVLAEVEEQELETPHIVGAYRLLLLTGCRLREVQTLAWEDVRETRIFIRDGKTGDRWVPLTAQVRAVLAALPRTPGHPYVVEGKLPGQFATDLQKPWRRIRAMADLHDVRIHDLRHTYASRLVLAGEPLPMVMKLMGHTQIQTTMRYAHLADEPQREAAERAAQDMPSMLLPRQKPRGLYVVT